MKSIASRDVVTGVACPWCLDVIPITVHVGFANHRAPDYKRSTSVTIRRTIAVDHTCVEPTERPET